MRPEITIIVLTKDSNTLEDCGKAIYENTPYPYRVVIVNGGSKLSLIIPEHVTVYDVGDIGFVAQLNYGYERLKTDFFVCFADDFFPQDKWWEYGYEDYVKQFGEEGGILVPNDGIQFGKIATTAITQKSFVEKYLDNVYYDKRFRHYRADVDLKDRAEAIGKYFYSERCKIKHKHIRNPEAQRKDWPADDKTYARISAERQNEPQVSKEV